MAEGKSEFPSPQAGSRPPDRPRDSFVNPIDKLAPDQREIVKEAASAQTGNRPEADPEQAAQERLNRAQQWRKGHQDKFKNVVPPASSNPDQTQ